jgi:micrococcal nuclease
MSRLGAQAPTLGLRGLLVLFAVVLGAIFIIAPKAHAKLSTASYDYQVVGIYDGDTFYITMPGLPPELQRIGVRVRGVDTPEMRGKCEGEKRNALAAKAFTTRVLLMAKNHVTLKGLKWDKYGGRVDADVFVGGQKLSDMMITRGYARPYGGEKRTGWCGPND